MKHRRHYFAALVLLLSLAPLSWAQPRTWKLGAATLRPSKEPADEYTPSLLRVTVEDASSGQPMDLTAEVHITSINGSFISNDKLAVLGHGARVDTVVVFDLLAKREIDRFVCYEPRRMAESWVVYFEWYPAHSSGQPTDVILAYDLALSPAANRFEKDPGPATPEFAPWGPRGVGFPIYPDSNAQQKSYVNVVADVMEAERILGAPLVLLPWRKLVIPVTEGFDARTYRTHLAVVDLSQGLGNAVSRRIELPVGRYPRRTESPSAMQIDRMEAVSGNEVRLYLQESEYGVSSIVVDINP